MGLLEDIKDAIAIGLMIGTAYIVYRLATEGPRAVQETVGRIVEGIKKRVEEVAKHVTSRELVEIVREKEVGSKAKVYRDCVSYLRQAYGYRNGLISKFCWFVADVVWHTAGLVDPSDIYEQVYYYYMYYLKSGYDRRKAFKMAIDKAIETFRPYLELEVKLV